MKRDILSYLAVPGLLLFLTILGYLALTLRWNYELTLYFVFLITLIYIFIFEHLIPLKQEWKPNKQLLWTDLRHFLFSTALFDALGKALTLSLVIYIQDIFFPVSNFWNGVPLLIQLIAANIIGELLPYMYHRISHIGAINSKWSLFLWKIHAIHHIPTSLNWFKTNWIHPINMFMNTFLKMTPLLLLGFNSDIIFLVGAIHVVIAYLSHANIRTQCSILDYVIVTPIVHHFHHSMDREEAQNFGNTLPFWDILLGTYYRRSGPVVNVGVFQNNQFTYPKLDSYFSQLVFPLRRNKQ